jgi:lipid A 3-O-deacylase
MNPCPIFSAIIAFGGSLAFAETPSFADFPDEADSSFAVYFENDIFGGSDRDYSNGVRFALLSRSYSEEEAKLESGPFPIFPKVSEFLSFDSPANFEYHYGVSATQLIFTPNNWRASTQPFDERRYAGWLGLGFAAQAVSENHLNSLEFIVGTVGPNSLAETSQDFVHGLRDIEKFSGWDEQIPNEVTLDLEFDQKWRRILYEEGPRGFQIDQVNDWGLRLGTFRTLASAGSSFRFGYDLKSEFADPRISSTAYPFQRSADDCSIYGLIGTNIRAVAHDATLDGPLFRDFETGNEREAFVAQLSLGLGISYQSCQISYTHTFSSREYSEQQHHGEYGTILIRWDF